MSDFTDRVAVVTGAASGMGAATARELAARGATLVLVDLDGGGLRTVAGQCAELGAPAVSTASGDVGDSAWVDDIVDRAVEVHGRIDVLVTAAGTIHRADAFPWQIIEATSRITCNRFRP